MGLNSNFKCVSQIVRNMLLRLLRTAKTWFRRVGSAVFVQSHCDVHQLAQTERHSQLRLPLGDSLGTPFGYHDADGRTGRILCTSINSTSSHKGVRGRGRGTVPA